MASKIVSLRPRAEREESPHLGLYLRAGFNSQKDIRDALASGHSGYHGVVFDAANIQKQKNLLHAVRSRPLEAILDPQTLAPGFDAGRTKTVSSIEWAGECAHSPEAFGEDSQRALATSIADCVARHGFTGVLAPTHFVSGANDPWLNIDAQTCGLLRTELEKRQCNDVIVIYSLSMPMAVFRQPDKRSRIISKLPGYTAVALRLRIANFGKDATGQGLESYLEGARDFSRLGLPVVAHHLGGLIGLSCLAFGAVGGICHGVAMLEKFDIYKWTRPPSDNGGGGGKLVYIPRLDLFLKKPEAELLFGVKGAAAKFACRDTSIAQRGPKDMIGNPGVYFIAQRIRQISDVSEIPQSIRASEFVEREVRPLTDQALWAARTAIGSEKLEDKFKRNQARLDRLRPTFGTLAERSSNQDFADPPPFRAAARPK